MRLTFSRYVLFIVASILAVAFPISAGEIELVVRDENGAPIARAAVGLRLVDPQTRWSFPLRGESDLSGRVTFSGAEPGQYKISLHGETAKVFVAPDANPRVPLPQITLAPGEERVRAELELWRGVPFFCGVDFDSRDTRNVVAHLEEVDLGTQLELRLPDGAARSRLLVPGRWQMRVDPPPGFLLTDVTVNGRSVAGSEAFVELEPGDPPAHVTWYYSARARLHGKVTFAGAKVGVAVAAHLVEPGPWIDAVEERGGSVYEMLYAGVDNRGEYEMVLPDGRWEVRAVGASVAGSEPEVVDLNIAPGEVRRQDFEVWDKEGNGGSSYMTVKARGPEGEWLRRATIELWPLDPDRRSDAPTAREHAEYAFSRFRDVPAGDWIVGAAAEGFIEGTAEVPGFDPDDESRETIKVRLRRGATVHAVVDDDEGERVPDVQFRMERLDPMPENVVQDAAVVERITAPEAKSDTTGHAWMRGVWPGRYRLRGTVGGRLEATRFVRFREDGRLTESVEVDLGDGQEIEIEAELVAAARVTGHLVCSDGRPMPGLVSLVTVPAEFDTADMDSAAMVDAAKIQIDELPLRGSLHDGFAAGPMEQGYYYLGFRPEGYDRWTWVPGEENPAVATHVQASIGDPTDVGTVKVDCGPAVKIAPRVTGDEPLPDLRKRPPHKKIVTAMGTLERGGEKRKVREVTVDLYTDHVVVRGLPEGTGRIDLMLLNRFFRPGPQLEVSVEDEFDRGRIVGTFPVVKGIGGVLRVADAAAAAVRVTAADGVNRIEEFDRGRVEVPSLEAGTYEVELCPDLACLESSHRWPAVEVEAHRIVELTR